jgi:flagellar biosynthetic protein FliQ
MVYDESHVQVVRDMLLITLKIAAPILAAGIVVGLVISIFQAVTQIQDQSITFVPKIVVMIAAAGLLLPWIVSRMVEYAAELFMLHGG